MDEEYLDKKVREVGKDVFEQERPDLLKQFKATVTSTMCRFFKNPEELKLVVLESLLDIERNRELVGWVRADAVSNPAPLIEEIGRLQKENMALREDLDRTKAQSPSEERYNGYEFNQLYDRLDSVLLAPPVLNPIGKATSHLQPSKEVSALTVFWNFRKTFCAGFRSHGVNIEGWLAREVSNELMLYGLVDRHDTSEVSTAFNQLHSTNVTTVKVTPVGHQFLSRLDRDKDLTSRIPSLFG